MPIKLSNEAERILSRFYDRPVMSAAQRQTYRDIEQAYNRFLRIFLLSVQDVLTLLCAENLDDVDLVISFTCESLHWARRSLCSSRDKGYRTITFAVSGSSANALKEANDLVVCRLASSCPEGVFLENTLIRLTEAYNLASGLVKVAEAIAFTRNRKSVVQRKKG